MLLILEMGRPFAGLMQISTVGVAALTHCRKKVKPWLMSAIDPKRTSLSFY